MSRNNSDKKKKVKTVYLPDKGETLYPMSFLEGLTPEEQAELDRKNKSRISASAKERWAMLSAAITVYGPILLCCVGAFTLAALFLYFFLK